MVYRSLNSPFGPLTLFEEDGAIVVLEFGRAGGGGEAGDTPLLRRAADQLNAYFDGTLHQFDLPLRPGGGPFQRRVCDAMARIPYGRTRTYGDLAQELCSSPRAVGGACGRNPIPILIPCHRVMGANGRLTGFSGAGGVETKQALLRLEGAQLI
ncbi:MAG: methylated-DNA--[protein]-cysteine S-methyltransferase [Hyphomicrobiales bacterium]|nr:methylated-DNA--[protein]-cysteine S-methyltransferase [Hyphomicrobiales bacterium]MCP5370463.1 methylated-DNA--[protein]-cysteine S-methyltransferase [Hyphomicrobiales bacterium]